jgi:hypothetical protein
MNVSYENSKQSLDRLINLSHLLYVIIEKAINKSSQPALSKEKKNLQHLDKDHFH